MQGFVGTVVKAASGRVHYAVMLLMWPDHEKTGTLPK